MTPLDANLPIWDIAPAHGTSIIDQGRPHKRPPYLTVKNNNKI
jgi:hypothetical protein